MARNTVNLLDSNVFKPASTTIEAADILAGQLMAYEGLLRPLQNPVLSEALRENDIKQVRTILDGLLDSLKDWLLISNG